MIMRSVPDRYDTQLKDINGGLYAEWDEYLCRWMIMHKDQRTALVRTVFMVEDEEYGYMDLNENVLNRLKTTVQWDEVGKYPDVDDLVNHRHKLLSDYRNKQREDRIKDIETIAREDKRQWQKVIDAL